MFNLIICERELLTVKGQLKGLLASFLSEATNAKLLYIIVKSDAIATRTRTCVSPGYNSR